MKYENKKNGKTYKVIDGDVINTTNDCDGQRMVFYTCTSDESIDYYVREYREFHEKFVKVDE